DGDGLDDIALAGGDWGDVPVAYYKDGGTFEEHSATGANGAIYFPEFAFWGGQAGGVLVSGDFYGRDGHTDLAMVGVSSWTTIPIAFGDERGTFGETYGGGDLVPEFQLWSTVPGAKILTGDFNRDGHTDIAIVGPWGWETIPVAFSRGDGTWRVVNA